MVERNCSNCGRELPAGRRFCGGCGQPVAVIAEPARAESIAPSCVKCGTAFVPGKRFCKQCGHAVATTEPDAASQPFAPEQDEPAAKKAVRDEAPAQAPPPIAVPSQPELTALCCSKCGAVIASGKRFCKQCGHAVATPAPTAAVDSHPIEQDGPAARESNVPVVESDHATAPPLSHSTPGQTFSTYIDPAPPEILPGPASQAEPAIGPDEDFKPASHEEPNLSSHEEGFRPLFKFSADEQEPFSVPPLQADLAAHDSDETTLG